MWCADARDGLVGHRPGPAGALAARPRDHGRVDPGLRRAFSLAGLACPLDIAKDGAEAIARLTPPFLDARPRPTGVLLDLKLPLVSGLEVLAWMRGHPELSALPVIVLTSSDDHRDIEAATALGVDAYLVKPVAFTDLLARVLTVASIWRLETSERAAV